MRASSAHINIIARLCVCVRFLTLSRLHVNLSAGLANYCTKDIGKWFSSFFYFAVLLHTTAYYFFTICMCECVKDMRKSWQNQLEIKFEWKWRHRKKETRTRIYIYARVCWWEDFSAYKNNDSKTEPHHSVDILFYGCAFYFIYI